MFWKTRRSKAEWIYFFLSPLVILFALEFVRFADALGIVNEFSSFWFPVKWLLSYLFILGWEGAFLTLTGSALAANAVVSVILVLLGISSSVICNIVGDPLLPNHLFLAANAGEISSMAEIEIKGNMVTAAVIVLAGIFVHALIRLRGNKKSAPVKRRYVALGCVFLVFCSVYTYLTCVNHWYRYSFLRSVDVRISAFNPIDDYERNGLILTFFPRIGSLFAEKPEGYSDESIRNVKEEYGENNLPVADTEKHPNIIVIQSEALWDPTRLPNVTYSQDPMPFLHELQEEGKGGWLVSPVFAGGTCLPEFEFLTGFSTRFLYSTAYPYIQYVTKPTSSVVSTLRDNGYETLAFHPYHKNFYSRNTAYPLLGFDRFIGISDLSDFVKSGAYVSDMYMTEQIIKAYEAREKDSFFMFNVSMQNHGAYQGDRYEEYDVELSCDGMSEEDLGGLQAFTQGVYEADEAFRVLCEYFLDKEPTVIMMYGDHLPLLGTDNSTYKKGGIVEDRAIVDFPNEPQMYETPYVVWSNYDTGAEPWPERISAAKLGLSALTLSGVREIPWYFGLIYDFYDRYNVFQHYAIYDANGERVSGVDKDMEERYRWIQYDILNGKRYYAK